MDKPKSSNETLQQQQTHHKGITTNFIVPISNNFIDLSMQDQPTIKKEPKSRNSISKDTMDTQIYNKSTTDSMLSMRTLTLTVV